MDNEGQHQRRSPRTGWWIFAYFISPGLPFVCLRIGRAIGITECFLGVLAGLIAHLGLISVLTQTNGEPLQAFITLLMGVSIYVIMMWQYSAGQRTEFWTDKAKKRWCLAGRFFGGVIGIGIILNIIAFHFTNAPK